MSLPDLPDAVGSADPTDPRRSRRVDGNAARGRGAGLGPAGWGGRWRHLARTVGLDPRAPVLVALSGGADSTYLLHVLAAARERPRIQAMHVDHGLRGSESARDAAFCTRLCGRLAVPLSIRRVTLAPAGPSLEARAREARYRALAVEARRLKLGTLVTGHHADDTLETLLMRWIRGTGLTGLAALRPRLELELEGRPLTVVRPLYGLRREEVRELLVHAGLPWCEDSSNRLARFTRNRVRNVLLPGIERVAGSAGIENLRAFGRAVEELEQHLARATAELHWVPPSGQAAHRSAGQAGLGGSLARGALMRLPYALRRRALWRLVLEGTGRAPRRGPLEAILDDLGHGRCTRHALPRGHALQLRARTLELVPPTRALEQGGSPGSPGPFSSSGSSGAGRPARGAAIEPWLPFPAPHPGGEGTYLALGEGRAIALEPGAGVALGDGRLLTAERVRREPSEDVPRGSTVVELDAAVADQPLSVRWPRPGDRFHPLGAPGSRPLRRVLADHGVPREERDRVPLLLSGERIVWVAGVRPAEPARVRRPAGERLRLALVHAAPHGPAPGAAEEPEPPPPARRIARGQRSFWEAC